MFLKSGAKTINEVAWWPERQPIEPTEMMMFEVDPVDADAWSAARRS
jgi:hypothetical protein